ncbi:hypothetical protein ACFVKB_34905 [Rhodococcus sp. NPDC127530]|uniref:hypothetical protein n=1 Tax=unclassified Rhodococcus (in: high G+C Gram-positive bacteria) TaxID=192944 RepID=UPI0036341B85
MKFDSQSIPDWSRSTPLDDFGLAGYHAAICVNEDGSTAPWLVAATNEGPHGCACKDCAPHEQHTRIPQPMREALHMTCGRPRADGRPCRSAVRSPGLACHQHAERERIA